MRPSGGHDPRLLGGERLRRFVADHVAANARACRRSEMKRARWVPQRRSPRPPGRSVFNAVRKLLRDALDTGAADRIGLSREFVVAAPAGRQATGQTPRRPFRTRSPARWPTRTTWPASPKCTTRSIVDCATCGRPPCSPAVGSAR